MHEKCWFKNNCDQALCNENVCLRYDHFLEILKASNLTENQWYKYEFEAVREDLHTYQELAEIKKNIAKFYEEFNSLYLWSSNYLNGKTTWAIKLLQSYMAIWSDNQFTDYPCGYFVKASEIKEAYSTQIDNKERFEKLSYNMKTTELLVIDDIDHIIDINNSKINDWLSGIIDYRYSHKKSIIYTSHLSAEQFKAKSNNDFLNSRVIDISKIIEFKAPTYNKVGGQQ